MVEASSALSEEIKLSTLSEEVTRRLRNTSRRVSNTRRLEILEKVCVKMATSGHQPRFMRKAIVKGITRYEEKVRRSELPSSDTKYTRGLVGRDWEEQRRKP